MGKKVVFIDWDDTLSHSKFWSHWIQAEPHNYQAIQGYLFTDNKEIVRDWMAGRLEAEDVCEKLSPQLRIGSSKLLRDLEISCRNMHLADVNILGVVQKLRRSGIKAVIATDNMDTFTRWTAPSLRLREHFDHILDSYTLKRLKFEQNMANEAGFFDQYLQDNNVSLKETVLFDDSVPKVELLSPEHVQITQNFPLSSALKSYFRLT